MKIPTATAIAKPEVPITVLLDDPEKLLAMTDEQLRQALAPYIPETRKAVLPEEKPSKIGVSTRVMRDFMSDPSIKSQLEALRNMQRK